MIFISMGISPSIPCGYTIFIFFYLTHVLPPLLLLHMSMRTKALTTCYSDINALILDYLTMEGYPNAAANFSKEANLQPLQESASIQARQDIQNCIHSGDIQSAIETLNELDPEVCSHFSFIFALNTISPHMIKHRVIHAPRIGSSDPWMRNNHHFMISLNA